MINLPNLLSACAQAAFFAGNEIRKVIESKEDLQIIDKSLDNTNASTSTSTIHDPQTIADRKAQFVILSLLRMHFPNVTYIAEEDEEEDEEDGETLIPYSLDMNHIPESFFQGLESSQLEENPKNISIWIDPMDGTQMFLSKEYEACSVLIGVAINDKPVLGIIHLPFTMESYIGYYNSVSSDSSFVLHGNYNKDNTVPWKPYTIPDRSKSPSSNEIRIITSPKPSSKRDAVLKGFISEDIKITYSSAAGTMLLQVLRGQMDVYLRCREGTMRWDFCACDAVLLAAGGALVDCYGKTYNYNASSDSYKNMYGAIATMNIPLMQKFLTRMMDIDKII